MATKIIYFIAILIVFSPVTVIAGAHDHYDSMVSDLTSSGHLSFSLTMRSSAQADTYCGELGGSGNCPNIVYDDSLDALRFQSLDVDQLTIPNGTFSSITSGKAYWQVETYVGSGWADSYVNETGVTKFYRPRKNAIGVDDRLFDLNSRQDAVCQDDDTTCPGFIASIRCYDCAAYYDGDTYIDGYSDDDWQPGGDNAAPMADDPFALTDHLDGGGTGPFLHRTGVWIRETWELDVDNGRVRYWLSDEDNDTTLVVADVSNSTLGYPLNPTSSIGLNEFQFGINSSSTLASPTRYNWHRNLIVAHDLTSGELADLLSGRPGGSGSPQNGRNIGGGCGNMR